MKMQTTTTLGSQREWRVTEDDSFVHRLYHVAPSLVVVAIVIIRVLSR